MPKLTFSPSVSPEQLRDEADRVAQGFTAEEQARTVDLMTPVMSEAEPKASLSPPSKGLSDTPPLFEGMAYLNGFLGNDHQTPQKSTNGSSDARHSNAATPTRSSGSGSLNRRLARSSHHEFATSPTRRLNFVARTSTGLSRSSSQHSQIPNFDNFMQVSPSADHRLVNPSRKSSAAASLPRANMSASKERRRSSLQRKVVTSESPTTVSRGPLNSHAAKLTEAARSVENEDDESESDLEINAEVEISALKEARREYSNREPDFIIGKPRDSTTRKVDGITRDGTLVGSELLFEYWDQDQTRGFWTYTDGDGDRFIVKFFGAGAEYRPWLGVKEGYHRAAMAFARKGGRSSVVPSVTGQGTVVVGSDASDNETSEDEHRRTLRKRNIDQIHPYSTEKTNYKRSKDGRRKKNFKKQYSSTFAASTETRPDRSNQLSRPPPSSRRASGQNKAASKSRLSIGSTAVTLTSSPTPEPVSLEMIQSNTTLYVFVESDFDAAPGTLYLKSCRDIDSFFSKMPLVAGVEEGEIRQITVRFDWLPDSTLNTIRMIRGLADSYDKMVEEISRAPAWKKGGDRKVDIHVNVVRK